MFCTKCGTKNPDNAQFCTSCGTSCARDEKMEIPFGAGSGATSAAVPPDQVPAGVKGWSWGAFLLNWIWAIGNRSWWGLLAVIPYIGFVVAVWLGFKGREMAWRNRQWDSVDHFNRVQKKWSQWGVGVVVGLGLLGIAAAIAVPAYQDYVKRAKAQRQLSEISSRSNAASGSTSDAGNRVEPTAAADNDERWEARLRATAEQVNRSTPSTVDRDTRLDTTVAGPGRKFTYIYTLVNVTRESIADSQLEEFAKTVKNRVCTNQAIAEFFQNKTVVGYLYNDKDGNVVTRIDVRPSDCGY
jgi:Tfp pilus assembly major pilin PilA/ribosomal protein L40E